SLQVFLLPPVARTPDTSSFPTRRSSDLRVRHEGRHHPGDLRVDDVREPAAEERRRPDTARNRLRAAVRDANRSGPSRRLRRADRDRKSTRLNSSHEWISYAVFCLKKKIG